MHYLQTFGVSRGHFRWGVLLEVNNSRHMCVAIIKLKTSGCCGCIIYKLLGFPEVILGGVSYWKSTILVICVLKVLNWPYNFLFDVHTLNNLFVPEIKDQIVLFLINN